MIAILRQASGIVYFFLDSFFLKNKQPTKQRIMECIDNAGFILFYSILFSLCEHGLVEHLVDPKHPML
jgi:hypothetical protein